MPKISSFHLFILQIDSILESHHMNDHIHFWPSQPLNFQRPFNLHEFVPAYKKSVNFWDTVNVRVQRLDLLNLLWTSSSSRNYAIWVTEYFDLYLRNKIFPKQDLCRNTANNKHIEQILWELMTKFFFKFKKPFLGPFPRFLVQKKFFKKIRLSGTTSQWLLAPWQNSEKSDNPIPRKHPDRCQEARMDRLYFMGSFQLPLGV